MLEEREIVAAFVFIIYADDIAGINISKLVGWNGNCGAPVTKLGLLIPNRGYCIFAAFIAMSFPEVLRMVELRLQRPSSRSGLSGR